MAKGHHTSNDGAGSVYWLTLTRDGRPLYAGGSFLNLGGVNGIVSIDTRTGKEPDWQPNDPKCSTGNSTCRPFSTRRIEITSGRGFRFGHSDRDGLNAGMGSARQPRELPVGAKVDPVGRCPACPGPESAVSFR